MMREKSSGITVHLGVDTKGLPHAVRVRTGEVSNRDGGIETRGSYATNLSKVVNVLWDGGYSGENFADAVKVLIGAEGEVVKRNELHTFVVLPKRWVSRAKFRVAGKVSPSLEELRRRDTYDAGIDGSCVYLPTAKKILNRL